jgi:probable F420-dependent oxidoreductase
VNVGVGLPNTTPGSNGELMIEWARRADAGPFSSLGVLDRLLYDSFDPFASLAAAAAVTERIGLATMIAIGPLRPAAALVKHAASVQALSGGRLTLGLGTGTRRMQRDWHGLDGEHPASRMEELVPLLRRLWRLHDEGAVEHEGRFYTLRVKPTAAVIPPVRPEIPVYMAGVNPRMVEAAGRVGDGLVGHPLFTPEYVRDVVRPALERGAERTGRDAAPPIAGYLTCCVDADREAARQNAAAIVAFNSTVKTYEVIHRHHGFEPQVEAIRTAWRSGDFAGMAGAVTDEMLDTIALAGTPDEVRARYEERWQSVYEQTLLWPPAFLGLDGTKAVIEAFAATPSSGRR